MAEAVDKERLHDPLEVVEAEVVHGVGLDRMDDPLSLISKVLIHGEVVEDGVDEKRAYIFPEEQCAVVDLRA
jgi:hypothetical protein